MACEKVHEAYNYLNEMVHSGYGNDKKIVTARNLLREIVYSQFDCDKPEEKKDENNN
jgi:hypothetical protein